MVRCETISIFFSYPSNPLLNNRARYSPAVHGVQAIRAGIITLWLSDEEGARARRERFATKWSKRWADGFVASSRSLPTENFRFVVV